MTNPLITTIIPTYRRPKSLTQAIQSVLEQSFTCLRVCVYDNASGDETKEVVEEWIKKDARVHYFCHEKNIGSNANFHFGLAQVKTPYFSFLSDDDFLFPAFYKEAIDQLQKFPNAAFFGGSTLFIDEKGKVLELQGINLKEGYHPRSTIFPSNNWSSHLFRTKEAKQVDLNPEIYFLDAAFMIRMYSHYPQVLSLTPCAVFRRHPLGLSSQCSSQELHDHYQKLIHVLNEDTHISETMRTTARIVVKNLLKGQIFSKSLRFIVEKNYQKAWSERLLLEKLVQDKQKSLSLGLLLMLCQKSCFVHQIFCYLLHFLRLLKNRKKKITLPDGCLSVLEKFTYFEAEV